MGDYHGEEDYDVSSGDVTPFKNNPGPEPPLSEVGLETSPIQTTSSSARLPPEPSQGTSNMGTQQQHAMPLPVPNFVMEPQPSPSSDDADYAENV